MDRRTGARLAAQAAMGDTHAFSQLYAEIYKRLYYCALSNLRSSHDAADAVQDAVLDAFGSIGQLKNAAAFDKWMFTILSAKIRQKQKEYSEERISIQELPQGLAPITEDGCGRCEILEELGELGESERLCLTLYSIAGYSTREIAEITGVAPATVRSYISRGRAKLRKGLKLSEKRKKGGGEK